MTQVQAVEQAEYAARHRGAARPVVMVTEHLHQVEGLWRQVMAGRVRFGGLWTGTRGRQCLRSPGRMRVPAVTARRRPWCRWRFPITTAVGSLGARRGATDEH